MNKHTRVPLIYDLLHPIAELLFSVLYWPRIRGIQNIPRSGKVVLAGNHKRSVDCFMVMAGTMRPIHFLAKAELFKGPLNGFFRAAGLIPVYRKGKDHAALAEAMTYLNDNRVVALFPEGTINRTADTMMPLKMGAVKMAHDTGAPIVTFTISGSYIPFFGGIKIVFHEPYFIQGDDLEKENELLRNKLAAELEKQRKGNRS